MAIRFYKSSFKPDDAIAVTIAIVVIAIIGAIVFIGVIFCIGDNVATVPYTRETEWCHLDLFRFVLRF